MSESTIALIISTVTALVALWGGWRLWLDSKANRHVQSRDVTVKEWAALLAANKALQDQLEERLAANDAEIKRLCAKIQEMEVRHDRERETWIRENRALTQRVAYLEKENRDLRSELNTLKAQACTT